MIDLYHHFPELKACEESIEHAYQMLKETYLSGGKILLCGNGGSCSDCEHIVGELMKGFLSMREPDADTKAKLAAKFPEDSEFFTKNLQRGIPAVSLAAHSGVFTAFANDVTADMVYAQMVYGLGRENDLVWGISTSGNSKNVVNAIKVASALGLKTLGMTGEKDSKMSAICDETIQAPHHETYRIQEYHLPIYHYLCAKLEQELFG